MKQHCDDGEHFNLPVDPENNNPFIENSQDNIEDSKTIDNKQRLQLPSLEECIWQAVDANMGAVAFERDCGTVRKVYEFIARQQ